MVYSPQVFSEIIAADMDLLTYYKGACTRAAVSTFSNVDYTAPDASSSDTFELTERSITLKVARQPATTTTTTTTTGDAVPAGTVRLRLIIRRSPDGHQTPILTNRTDLTAAEIAYRMGNRWRQENYFKYGREHFALDALDSYADHPDDLTRAVSNPAKHRAKDKVKAAGKDLTAAHAGVADALDSAVVRAGQPGNDGKALVDPAAGLALN